MTPTRGLVSGLVVIVAGVGSVAPANAAESMRGMLLKYVARCALAEGQFLEDEGAGHSGSALRYPGSLGLAPEWLAGTCGADCQERVSACLIALTNRTGKHVEVSLLSSAPGTGDSLRPSAQDLPFPHQEGAFFGNMFTGQAFACRGRDAVKAPQAKRFCAVEPESCSGLADFRAAGRCDDVCEMSCRTLPDGSERCAAVSCHDPEGRVWRAPITTYLSNRIQAGNADGVRDARRKDGDLDRLRRGSVARFTRVDFGAVPGAATQLVLAMEARHPGRIQAWLDGRQLLGKVDVRAGASGEQVIALPSHRIAGLHTVSLNVVAGRDLGRLRALELRGAPAPRITANHW